MAQKNKKDSAREGVMSNSVAGGNAEITFFGFSLKTVIGSAVALVILNASFAQIQLLLLNRSIGSLEGTVGQLDRSVSNLSGLDKSVGMLEISVKALEGSVGRLDGMISKNTEQIAKLDKTIVKLDGTVHHLQESVTKISTQASRIEESAKVIKGIEDDLRAIRKAIVHQDKLHPKDNP